MRRRAASHRRVEQKTDEMEEEKQWILKGCGKGKVQDRAYGTSMG